MKINIVNSRQPMNSNFSGLSKKMGYRTYVDGQKEIKPFVDSRKAEGKSLTVGTLPPFIMKKLNSDNKLNAIQEIYKTFDEIAVELRTFDESKAKYMDEIMKLRSRSTVDKLNDVLHKYKIISKFDDVDIEYLGKGGKGAGYKITGLIDTTNGNEDEFVIKVFHVVEGENWQPYKSHGCYAEINSAEYWTKTLGKNTNRGKFFFANLGSGYMVNKFIDEDVRLPQRIVEPYNYGLKYTDEDAAIKHNVCKGYSYDWGGVRVINRIKNGDKYARTVLEKIKNIEAKYRTAKWWEIFCKKTSNDTIKNAGLAMGIKYLDNKPKHIDTCMKLNQPKVNQALAYVLKYLPYEQAISYFEKLVKTNDVLTQVVLFNEIPLLCMKHRDKPVQDDLQTIRSEILPSRIIKYYDIAEKYALPDSIEHLASFVHLLPKNNYKTYYSRLVNIDNEALVDRMIYKLSSQDKNNLYFAVSKLANVVNTPMLREKLLSASGGLSPEQMNNVRNILEKTATTLVK